MVRFTKMHGIGNDFVMVDAIRDGLPKTDLPELARHMNDRRFGVGGDGLILVERGESAQFRMRMLNPDGSESEMCGNGIRCFARLLRDHGHTEADRVDVETGAGVLNVVLLADGRVQVDMGPARLLRGEIGMLDAPGERFVEQPLGDGRNGTAVSMGNPHLVLFEADVASLDLAALGPALERHRLFPKRTNVHFVQVVDRSHIVQRTWERGAGITLACGTGACASVVSSALTGRTERTVEVSLPGGRLDIQWLDDGRVLMNGPAETVFTGTWPG